MTGRDRREERRERRSGEELREREFKALKARIEAIRSVVTRRQLGLLDEHFKKYPWGILKGEFVAYLMDYRVDGRSINGELEPFLSAGPDRRARDKLMGLKDYNYLQLTNVLAAKIARRTPEVFIEEEFAFRRRAKGEFVETQKWEHFALSFLSQLFKRGKKGKGTRKILHLRIGASTTFFAKDIVELWARLFLEAEEDIKLLMDDKSIVGYVLLKEVKDKKLTTHRDIIDNYVSDSRAGIHERLDELKRLGLVSIARTGERQTYGLTPLATKAFGHLEKYMGNEADIRNWPYRYNILFPGARRAPPAPAPKEAVEAPARPEQAVEQPTPPERPAKAPAPPEESPPLARPAPPAESARPTLRETLGHVGFLLLRVGSLHPKRVAYPFEGAWPAEDRGLRDSLRAKLEGFPHDGQPLRDLLALAGDLMLVAYQRSGPGDNPRQVWKRIDDRMKRARFQELVCLSVYRGTPRRGVPDALSYAQTTVAPMIRGYVGPEQAKTDYNAQDIFMRILKRMRLIGQKRR